MKEARFRPDHWRASVDGGLAHRIDYSFTADQFELRRVSQRRLSCHTGAVNLGYRFSDRTSIHGIFRVRFLRGAPGQVFYGLTDLLGHETYRDSAVSVHLDDRAYIAIRSSA